MVDREHHVEHFEEQLSRNFRKRITVGFPDSTFKLPGGQDAPSSSASEKQEIQPGSAARHTSKIQKCLASPSVDNHSKLEAAT